MESIARKRRIEFNAHINRLMADVQSVVENEQLDKLDELQRKLDKIADKYQEDDLVGRLRYKLYEAQAIIYYFQQNDTKALQFIDEAVAVRGEEFESAQKLRMKLQPQPEARRGVDEPVGVGGWLAFLVVGIALSIILNLYYAFDAGRLYSELTPYFDTFPGLRGAMWFEAVGNLTLAFLAIGALFMILNRKRGGKTLAITLLATAAVFNMIDYLWAVSIFDGVPEAANEASDPDGMGRSLVSAAIWIPYLLVSKRIKNTLVE